MLYHTSLLLPLLLVLWCSSTITTSTATQQQQQQQQQRRNGRNGYIVELLRPPSESTFFDSGDGDQHSPNRKVVRYTYDSDLLYGASVEFDDSASAKAALAHPDIINAWPITHHSRPTGIVDTAEKVVDKAMSWRGYSPEQVPVLTRSYNEAYRELGVNGSSVRVGVIDSGVDYRHPALGGCFGSGCKIEFGYDLVGDAYNGTHESIQEDDDPLDNCPPTAVGATGHGTFVSGLIGATDTQLNWTGTAPAATLGMWRVFGCNSQIATTDVFLKAMEMAYKADMDILNLSFGQDGGWHEDAVSVFADRLVSRGVHVVVASGNIGTSGIMLTASPATGNGVIAVSSSMNSQLPGFVLEVTKDNTDFLDIPYRTIVNQPISFNQTLPLRSINDSCSPFDDGHKYKGTITVIHASGDCDLMTKLDHAKNADVTIALVYMDSTETVEPDTRTANAQLPVGFINAVAAEAILKLTTASKSDSKNAHNDENVKGHFTRSLVALKSPKKEANRIASFSSLGPTNELVLKPELTATGGDMFSTLPLYKGGYGVLSGTSMSAPLISGSIALFLSALDESQRKNLSPEDVKGALMNFARPVGSPISRFPQYGDSPIRQGAGLVSVVRAIQGYEQFHVSPSKLSFNDTEHFVETQTLTIHNHGSKDTTFNLVHGPALTVAGYNVKNTSDYVPLEPISFAVQDKSVATISFEQLQVQVPAGDSVEVQLTLKPPSNFNANSHAIYGGYIGVETVNKTTSASVPYIGMVGNMSRLPILDRSSDGVYPFPSVGNPDGTILKNTETGKYKPAKFLRPTVLVRLLTGTPLLDLEIVQDDEVIGTVPFDELGPLSRAWLPRNTRSMTSSSTVFHEYQWDGQYQPDKIISKTQYVETGTYRIRVRALHVFGDRDNDEDWDEWLSPPLYMDMDASDGDDDDNGSLLPTASITTSAPGEQPSNSFANHPSATDFAATPTPTPFTDEEEPVVPSGTEGFTVSVSPA
ncbi:peptidase S8/S53 domain-containing protein [Zychaea mexicana]|uniref:peptidase S8/S53 domain-containing protein n=1 Tax=Zychaea mexicana TaxID=64656 RepID=UPI0022FF232F|nr:peptidase S8/S53 domain-containing protein [Zychaea mexicana]KAI9494879.1 peptidase S8/S53 domain-containing protein [Zychaea mexicana]